MQLAKRETSDSIERASSPDTAKGYLKKSGTLTISEKSG